jgi:hypothetical protein
MQKEGAVLQQVLQERTLDENVRTCSALDFCTTSLVNLELILRDWFYESKQI